MPDTLDDLVTSSKLIAVSSDWVRRGRRLELVLPLEIDEVIEEGLLFRAAALERLPDREMMFQLEYHGVRIAGGKGPEEFRFLDLKPSHVHLFEDNWCDSNSAMKTQALLLQCPPCVLVAVLLLFG